MSATEGQVFEEYLIDSRVDDLEGRCWVTGSLRRVKFSARLVEWEEKRTSPLTPARYPSSMSPVSPVSLPRIPQPFVPFLSSNNDPRLPNSRHYTRTSVRRSFARPSLTRYPSSTRTLLDEQRGWDER